MSGTGHWGQIDVGKEEIVAWLSRLSRLSPVMQSFGTLATIPKSVRQMLKAQRQFMNGDARFRAPDSQSWSALRISACDSVERDMKVARCGKFPTSKEWSENKYESGPGDDQLDTWRHKIKKPPKDSTSIFVRCTDEGDCICIARGSPDMCLSCKLERPKDGNKAESA